MGEESKPSDQRHDDFLELHRTAIHDIAFFKLQQWRVTNYGLLLYVTVVAIPRFLPLSRLEAWLLWLLSLTVLVVGWIVLCRLEESLGKGRGRAIKIHEYFSKEAQKAWEVGGKITEVEEKVSMLWLFRSVLLLGFVVVTWLLYRSSC